jgi:hypothetical protein
MHTATIQTSNELVQQIITMHDDQGLSFAKIANAIGWLNRWQVNVIYRKAKDEPPVKSWEHPEQFCRRCGLMFTEMNKPVGDHYTFCEWEIPLSPKQKSELILAGMAPALCLSE